MSLADLEAHELLQKAEDFFERRGVLYRIVGSMASMAYSEARFTNDIDFVVDLRVEQVESLAAEFPSPDFYLWIDAARIAIHDRRQFNIIHVPSGLKLDIIQRKNTEFGALDISAGRKLKIDGLYDVWFGSPENVILMKLRYFQEGGPEKHLRDISSILLVQDQTLDRAYLAERAAKLGVTAEWELVLTRINQAGR